MNTQETKELVVQAGRRLVETGLIVRTWGNVSCRIDDGHFAITPTGRDYLSLKPEDIVVVQTSDLSYGGTIKPSSEKGIHAAVYKRRPDVNFVIHTHQKNASAVSAMNLPFIELPEGRVICAAYGLPSTKKLRRGVIDALALSTKNAIIMKNHGALCFGKDYEETFGAASDLERFCENYIKTVYLQKSGRTVYDPRSMRQFALGLEEHPAIPSASPFESEQTAGGFHIRYANGASADIRFDGPAGELTTEERIVREIYLKNKNIYYVIYTSTPNIVAVSCKNISLPPLLDDFAQLAGSSVRTMDEDPSGIASALKNTQAVMIRNKGVLCCGGSKEDASAVSLVMEKNCEAYIAASLTGKIKPINHFECLLMRFIYLRKYSNLANIK
jgi:L-fuculose-phosphate aldolase